MEEKLDDQPLLPNPRPKQSNVLSPKPPPTHAMVINTIARKQVNFLMIGVVDRQLSIKFTIFSPPESEPTTEADVLTQPKCVPMS